MKILSNFVRHYICKDKNHENKENWIMDDTEKGGFMMKQYVERNGKTLKVEVYYTLGGLNYFTGRQEKRGYYLSVIPVEIKESNGIRSEICSIFSGAKELILEVKRRSKKAELEASRLAQERMEKLIEYVLSKNAA
jgi:hypothetical protein